MFATTLFSVYVLRVRRLEGGRAGVERTVGEAPKMTVLPHQSKRMIL
jgi:hypothetical protein